MKDDVYVSVFKCGHIAIGYIDGWFASRWLVTECYSCGTRTTQFQPDMSVHDEQRLEWEKLCK